MLAAKRLSPDTSAMSCFQRAWGTEDLQPVSLCGLGGHRSSPWSIRGCGFCIPHHRAMADIVPGPRNTQSELALLGDVDPPLPHIAALSVLRMLPENGRSWPLSALLAPSDPEAWGGTGGHPLTLSDQWRPLLRGGRPWGRYPMLCRTAMRRSRGRGVASFLTSCAWRETRDQCREGTGPESFALDVADGTPEGRANGWGFS